jgi:class 3 adenylate cyclase
MPEIDEALLDERLAELERARAWRPQVLPKLAAWIRGDEQALFRVNPLAFAEARGIDANEAVDLFLHAAHVGLFEMVWSIVCPVCGQTAQSFESLRTLTAHYFCGLCQMGAEANLDDCIFVAFTVSRRIRRIRYHDPQSLPLLEYFIGYRFIREARTQDGSWVGNVLRQFTRGCQPLRPGDLSRLEFEATQPELHATDADNDAGIVLTVQGDAQADLQTLRVRYDGDRFEPARASIRPGPVALEIDHVGSEPSSIMLLQLPEDADVTTPLVTLAPFVTGSMLLANQTFRHLFRSEVTPGDEGIGVRDVTLLFTDLTGSTALYDRVGDLQAFALVRQHFEHVGRVVQARGGAVVKTIGDAVMAVFLAPADAVAAALDMLATVEHENRHHDKLVLKVGLHRGPSIAVTLNENLDYFGQTVNIAARVQGLAGPNELWFSEEVYQSPRVGGLVEPYGLSDHEVQLRGIERSLRVYRARFSSP